MPELDDAALERRLRGVLQEHLGALPLDLTVETLDRRRATRGVARRVGRGRGMTLLAAAALLLVGGALAGSGFLRFPTVVPPVPAPSLGVVATASPDASSPNPSEPTAPSASPIPVAGLGGVWIPTGSMVEPRDDPTTVRLQDGKLLVVGGRSGVVGYQHDLTSAELYDPATGTWSATGSISKPLVAAISLRDGRVLVLVGHFDSPRSAEVYDPASGTWTATGPMDPSPMESDKFTLLQDGRVLLAGSDGNQVYDPASGTWTATGPAEVSSLDSFTVLRDGRVLVAGGDHAQVYDPASGTWTATGKKNGQGYGAEAVLLSDGKVLVAGGTVFDGDYHDLDSAEVYDPVTGSWTAIASMHAKANPRAAFLQPDGKVLLVVGFDGPNSHAEVYDPAAGTWTVVSLRPAVLAKSEWDGDGDEPACTAADLYDPRTGSWTTDSTTLQCGPRSLTPLLDGTVLVAGGSDCNDDGECASTDTAAVFVPAGVSLPPLPAFASPPPFVLPSPTPLPARLPPADGPVPPNARSWTVTVDNESSEPATLFVAEDWEGGLRLVGTATPNVVPAGTTVEVTFLFPASEDGWITVNPRAGEGLGGLVNADQIGIPGKIWIPAEGEGGWVGPAQ